MTPLRAPFWSRWHRPVAAAAAVAFEAWLLLHPDATLNGGAFAVLCALTCWVPAWLCADLLSIHTRKAEQPHREWAPREFLARACGRLRLYFPLVAVWVGSWTARTLAQDLQSGARPPYSVSMAGSGSMVVFTWCAWTLVFLASALAYASGAAMLSALCRRPRRWLLVPMLVPAITLCTAGIVEWLLQPQMGGGVSHMVADPATNWQPLLSSPNYVLGATTSMGIARLIDSLGQPARESIGRLLGEGIAPFCWLATAFFLGVTAATSSVTWWVARQRQRRHPYTVTQEAAAEPMLAAEVEPSAPAGVWATPASVLPEEQEQCLST